jgi:hypothetical protein
MCPAPNTGAALPAASFIPASVLKGSALPIVLAGNTALPLPSLVRAVDFSGFNTLSTIITVSGISGGDNLEVDLVVEDPETGTATVFPIGFYNIFTLTTNGSFANTLYLPSYYAANSTNIMPFYQNLVNLVHNGNAGTSITISALKFWLTNA